MTKSLVISNTEEFVRRHYSTSFPDHDWFHVDRVRNTALALSSVEGGDRFIVEMGSLLHDVDDYKFSDTQPLVKCPETRKWLSCQDLKYDLIDKILHIVENISFRGLNTQNTMRSIEGFIVQDADRLDAIGAVGIARAFSYGGRNNIKIYDPELLPKTHNSFEEYKTKTNSSYNHFHEKLLYLKNLMNTKTAKSLAYSRDKFMRVFLSQLETELHGTDILP